ncbi:MAG: cytochrome C [Planctomycetes bacterium]|nr:cytochrome C [Planctomycetota bacterium]
MRVGMAVVTVVGGAVVLGAIAGSPGQDGAASGDRPTGPVDADTCLECHADISAHDAVHGPVVVNACDACHRLESAEEHTYELARPGHELCTFCHDVDLDAPVIHEPLRTGDCTGCHDPHGGPDIKLLKAPSVDLLCQGCHEDLDTDREFVHGPVAARACSVCHHPHASKYPGLLSKPSRDLCLDCHVSTRSQLETLRVVHGPAQVDCQACHDPHASDHPLLLSHEPQDLCLTCHESIRHAVTEASTQHSAVTKDRQCLNCHDAHASDYPRVLRTDMKTLCYECHDKDIELPDGTTLANIKAVIDAGTSLHGPVAQSNCAACHMIHGGDHFRLLIQEYPPEFYAPFAEERYALCFSCHDRQLVYDSRTTALTNFRNGDVNLHYLHVNREKKGRTCRACHETHASNSEKHIRDSVPFGSGGWKLPIGFEKTETGGSCSPGCHKPYGYDRDAPVMNTGSGGIWPAEPGASP